MIVLYDDALYMGLSEDSTAWGFVSCKISNGLGRCAFLRVASLRWESVRVLSCDVINTLLRIHLEQSDFYGHHHWGIAACGVVE